MSTKTGLYLSLITAMGPCVIMFFLSAFNVIAIPNGYIAGGVVLGSFLSALGVAKKTGNLD
jgi:hypothetical protein